MRVTSPQHPHSLHRHLLHRRSLDVYQSLGWSNIERHTNAIREWLYGQLSQLRHSNGAPMLRILGRHGQPDSGSTQGATFNFQILKPNGEVGRSVTLSHTAVVWSWVGRGGIAGILVRGRKCSSSVRRRQVETCCLRLLHEDAAFRLQTHWPPLRPNFTTIHPGTLLAPAGLQLPPSGHRHGGSWLPHAHRLHLQPGGLLW